MAEHILLIEHDAHLREVLTLHLGLGGYSCDAADDGEAGLRLAAAKRFDLVVMDLASVPDDGLRICRALALQRPHQLFESLRVAPSKVEGRRPPVLILAAAEREADALTALEQCADDYMVTPCGMRELVARVRGLIRRSRISSSPSQTHPAFTCAPSIVRPRVIIDPARRGVQVEGRKVKVTEQEFQLLYLLAARAGVVFDRETLLAQIWGDRTYVTLRSVDTLVKRLRRSFRQTGRRLPYLVTVRGVGYKFDDSVHGAVAQPS